MWHFFFFIDSVIWVSGWIISTVRITWVSPLLSGTAVLSFPVVSPSLSELSGFFFALLYLFTDSSVLLGALPMGAITLFEESFKLNLFSACSQSFQLVFWHLPFLFFQKSILLLMKFLNLFFYLNNSNALFLSEP